MTKEELIRNLKYTMEKHKNDKVDTFGTNISLMCKDVLDYLEKPTSDDCVSRAEVKKWLDINFCFGGAINKLNFFEKMDKEVPPVTPTRNKPKEDITEDEVRINMLELALNQAKEHAESIEVLTENHRLIFRAEKRGDSNGSN